MVIITLAWLYITHNFNQIFPSIVQFFRDKKNIAIITAFVINIWPVCIAIGKITEPFRKEVSTEDSLSKAGSYIGITERILVLVFILIGQYAATGFLIAGKSILRVGRVSDGETRKKTEYVLIGTLLSFTSVIIIGLLTKYIINL